MFKKIFITLALVTITGVLVFGAVNRTMAKNETGTRIESHSADIYNGAQIKTDTIQPAAEYSQGENIAEFGVANQAALALADSGELSDIEAAALVYMREEEKLAHDVYVTLGAQWSLPVFLNISRSEQSHTDAIKVLLDRYGLADPASNEVGVFTNPDLQALYNDLIARGSQSLAEALKVGAAIEEIDIVDLQERLAETDNPDIQQVFGNLLNGSYNHLRAFVSTISRQTGETYQPQYLDEQTYQTIIGTAIQTGGNGNRGGNGGRGSGSWQP